MREDIPSSLRLQTGGNRIHKSQRGLGGAALVIDLHELNIRKLFEVGGEQIRDGVGRTGAVTSPFEVDVRNTVDEFKAAIAGKAIGQIDPAVGKFLARAGTFEIFIQKQTIDIVALHIADTCHLKRRQIVGVAEFIHEI